MKHSEKAPSQFLSVRTSIGPRVVGREGVFVSMGEFSAFSRGSPGKAVASPKINRPFLVPKRRGSTAQAMNLPVVTAVKDARVT